MSHLRPTHLVFLFLLHCLFLLLSPANAVPLGFKRQLSNDQPQTLTTQTVTSTPAGDMTQTCVITLTPITDNNGNVTAVQEVKSCTVSLAGTNNSGSGSTSTNTTSSSPPETTSSSGNSTSDSSSTSSSSSGDSVSANGVSQVTPSATATGTDSTAASATDSSAASATDSSAASATDSSAASATDSSGASATDSADASTSTDTGSNLGAAAVSAGGGVIEVSATGNAAGASATPVAAAENAASASSSAFVVPGQSIQVLPIGLGIFGGISGIALIVVLYLTYKRRAYRKAFRARKLAEEGAAMGYGGTRT